MTFQLITAALRGAGNEVVAERANHAHDAATVRFEVVFPPVRHEIHSCFTGLFRTRGSRQASGDLYETPPARVKKISDTFRGRRWNRTIRCGRALTARRSGERLYASALRRRYSPIFSNTSSG